MSFDPFTQRLQETQQIEQEEEPRNPFEDRLKQNEAFSDSLWDSTMNTLFSEEEIPFEQGLGQALRSIGTSIGGLPGDTIQLTKGAANWIEEKFPTGEHFKRDPNIIQKLGREALEKIPTSEDLKDKFDKLTDNQYEPQSDREDFLQEIGGDAAIFLLGAGTWKAAIKALGIAVTSNLAKEGVKMAGFGEKTQAATKMGSMFLLSAFNPKGANKFVSDLYKKAEAVLPEGASIQASNLQKNLLNLENDLSRGIKTVSSKKPVLDDLNQIKANIKEGDVAVRDITEAKRNLNESRTAKIFDPEFKGTRKVRKDLKKNYGRLSKVLDDSIIEYGKQNPEYAKFYQDAQLGWGGIEQSKKASNFISRNIKAYKFKSSLGSLLGAVPTYFFPAQTAIVGGVGYSGLKSYELMHRIIKTPVLKKYYMNVLKDAAKESLPSMMNNLKKLDGAMLKEDKKK